MKLCSWCEKKVPDDKIIEHPLPDDDYVEICQACSVREQETIAAKKSELTYANA